MRAVNLLPRDAMRQRPKGLTVALQLAVVSPFVVGSLLVAGYLLASSKVNDNKATLQALKDQLAAVPPPVVAHQVAPELALQHDQRIIALGPALEARVAWDRILRQISSVLPGDVWLTTLSAESPPIAAPIVAPPPSTDTTTPPSTETTTTAAPPVPPPPPATSPLRLAGYTYSQEGVARLLSRLEVIPELQDVRLVQSSQTSVVGRDVVSFTIQASVRSQVSS
jgi:Tfp pilus assembly protein PilN